MGQPQNESRSMTVPQPFQYQGSKRVLAPLILQYLPVSTTRLRDPKLFPDASVDLVYLDPPFNSNADYNVLFREASGEASQAQFHVFTDTWNWADASHTYAEFVDHCPNTAVVEMVESLHQFLKNSPMMVNRLAYPATIVSNN